MTFDEARDFMFSVFLNNWGTKAVTWTDVPAEVQDDTWARVILRHVLGGQASLAGASGTKRWNRAGVLFIQIFAPVGDGSTEGYNLAQSMVNAYQAAKHENVWFRNVRMMEIGKSGAFEQINVIVDFSYDDVR